MLNLKHKHTMTKKEIRSAINKAVYLYAESLGYDMSDDNDGSYVTFYKPDDNGVNSIDYHRSYHETYVMNWASDEAKADATRIEEHAKEQIAKYELGS